MKDPKPLATALDDLRGVVQRMERQPSFEVRYEEYAVMPTTELMEWQDVVRAELQQDDYSIPQTLLQLYGVTGGFNLQWVLREGERPLMGFIRISSLPGLYQRDDEADMSMADCIRKAREFDCVADDEFAAIKFDLSGSGKIELLYTRKGQVMPLDLDPVTYVVNACSHVGIYGWQLHQQDIEREERLRTVLG